MFCVSVPGFIWQFGLKHTGVNLPTLRDEEIVLLLEKNLRGGISSVMGDRYVKSDEKEKISKINSKNLFVCVMSESLPYDEIKFNKIGKLESILNTPDDSDLGYFIEVALQ